MRNIVHLIELEDGFIGGLDDVAKHLGVSYPCVTSAVGLRREKICKKYKFKDLGTHYHQVICEVSDETGAIFKGNIKEIAEKFNYATSTVANNARKINGGKLGDYTIKKVDEKYSKTPMYI